MSSPFIVVFPGYSPIPVTEYVGEGQMKLDIRLLLKSDQFMVILSQEIPANKAVVVHVSVVEPGTGQSTNFEHVGHISNTTPSALCRVPRALLDRVGPNGECIGAIGFSVSDIDTVVGLGRDKESATLATTASVARFVAKDFHSFAASHAVGTPEAAHTAAAAALQSGRDILVLPAAVFDRWFERFNERCKRDPAFLRQAAAM